MLYYVSDSAFMVNLAFIANTITKQRIACEQSVSFSLTLHLSFVELSPSHFTQVFVFALFTVYRVVITSTEKPLSGFIPLSVGEL